LDSEQPIAGMVLYIKNMVCNRCIAAVKKTLADANIPFSNVVLGEAKTLENINEHQLVELKEKLEQNGFELLDDNRKKMIEKIKNVIIDQVHHNNGDTRLNLSDALTANLHKDYSYLSRLFSEVEGITIEKYYINQKIEKAKELLTYNQISLSEIAFQLGYSSVAHLSSQFKKVTGLTPSHFKSLGQTKRKALDQL
jgi:AraC family transcriptional regulator